MRPVDADALITFFEGARKLLDPSDYKTADEFNTRDLMLLNVIQVIRSFPEVKVVPIEDIFGHAKAIKEYCQQRDNLDDCCDECPFHDYLGTRGLCVLNYGLYPNEWYKPNNEESDTE